MKFNNENKDVVKVDIVVDVEKSEEIHDKKDMLESMTLKEED